MKKITLIAILFLLGSCEPWEKSKKNLLGLKKPLEDKIDSLSCEVYGIREMLKIDERYAESDKKEEFREELKEIIDKLKPLSVKVSSKNRIKESTSNVNEINEKFTKTRSEILEDFPELSKHIIKVTIIKEVTKFVPIKDKTATKKLQDLGKHLEVSQIKINGTEWSNNLQIAIDSISEYGKDLKINHYIKSTSNGDKNEYDILYKLLADENIAYSTKDEYTPNGKVRTQKETGLSYPPNGIKLNELYYVKFYAKKNTEETDAYKEMYIEEPCTITFVHKNK
jgi:hypothetical protein